MKNNLNSWSSRRGALRRNFGLIFTVMVLISAVLANYALSVDDVDTRIASNDFVDVGFEENMNTEKVSLDLVENSLTRKCLLVNVWDDTLTTESLNFYLRNDNFDVSGKADLFEVVEKSRNIKTNLVFDDVEYDCSTVDNETEEVTPKTCYRKELKSYDNSTVFYEEDSFLGSFDMNEDLAAGNVDFSSGKKLKLCFNTPIVEDNGFGNKGTVFVEIGNDLYVDRQGSSWWNISYSYRIVTTVIPKVTEIGNIQLRFNVTGATNMDDNGIVVIDNRSNAGLAWVNETNLNSNGFYIRTNVSNVSKDVPFDLEIYYNSGSRTLWYNCTQVDLDCYRFETQSEIDAFGDVINTGTWVLNSTNVREGTGAVTCSASGDKRHDFVASYNNVSIVSYIYIDNSSAGQHSTAPWAQSGTIFWQLGQRATGGTANLSGYGPYPGINERIWTIPHTAGWVKARWHTNSSGVTAYWDEEWVYTNNTAFTSNIINKWDINNEDGSKRGTYDAIYVYTDWGADNPNYSISSEEVGSFPLESEGRTAIVTGITNKIPSATIYTDQQIYVRYLNGTQILGSFDKVAAYDNQRWAFNYITSGESYTYMDDMEPSLYIWENDTLSYATITSQVEALIESTLD